MKVFVQGVAGRFRGDQLLSQCESLGFDTEFVAGPDARALTPDDIVEVYDEEAAQVVCGRSLSVPEIACTLGHLEMYRRMDLQGHEWALMFEDDARISPDILAVADRIPTLPACSIVTLRHEEAGALTCVPWSHSADDVRRLIAIPQGSSAYFIHIDAARLALRRAAERRLDSVPDWPISWGSEVRWYVSRADISAHADNDSTLRDVRNEKLIGFRAPWGNGGLWDRVRWAQRLVRIGYPRRIAVRAAITLPLFSKLVRLCAPRLSRADYHR